MKWHIDEKRFKDCSQSRQKGIHNQLLEDHIHSLTLFGKIVVLNKMMQSLRYIL